MSPVRKRVLSPGSVSTYVGVMTSTEDSHSGKAHGITRCAGRVLAALDEVTGTPAWSMTTEEQKIALVDLSRAQAVLAELRLRVLAAGDRNDLGKDSGTSSTAAWLAHNTRLQRTSAHADLRLATQLDGAFEATRAALAEGRVNEEQARVIVRAVTDLPDTVLAVDRGRAEAHLVEQAARFDAKALRVLGRRLFEVIDPEAADEEEGRKLESEERAARRTAFFRMRDNGDGSFSGSFKIPALHAEMLNKALQGLVAPRRIRAQARADENGDKVSYPTLLGHGLMELIEHLPTDRLPNCGGLSATVTVTLDLEALRTGLGAAGLDTGGRISAAEARRLACNAGIIPMVLGGGSMPLDVGRERRLHTRHQRIAMAQRDRGCTAENCDRPPGWTEAHHDVSWSEGGGTSVDNGRLLCPWHHRLAHDSGYTKKHLPNGKVRFRHRT